MSWRERAPGPFSLWARFAPRIWPATPDPYLDPFLAGARGSLATPRDAAGGAALADPPLEPDVVYLPPVPEERTGERDELAARIAVAGGHALVHLRIGERSAAPRATAVFDLLGQLLVGSAPERLELPAGSWVVVPLIAGLFEDEGHRRRWLDRLAAAGAAAVVGLPVALEPTERRRLAAVAGEDRWAAIFHGEPPGELAFAREAAAAALPTIPTRPEVILPPRAARNRDLATALAEAGELWLRLGRGEVEGEALLAAARRVAAGALDFAALAREGNLPVVDWLSPRARRLIEERLAGDSGELVALRREWAGEPIS